MTQASHRWRITLIKLTNLIVVIGVVTAFSAWASQMNAADAATQKKIDEAKQATIRGPYAHDGSYQGSSKGYGGTVTMEITIKNGYLSSVDIVDASHEDEAWLKMCKDVPESIRKAQSPDIDTVSGATFTSTGMINAVKKAIKKEESQGE